MQFTDASGNPLAGGKLYTYQAGTTTPLAAYTDSGGGTSHANPIILDARGEASIWLTDASYKFVLKDSTDATIWTVDNITNGASVSEYTKQYLTSVAGTNAIVGTTTYDLTVYSAGLTFRFVPAAINTSSVTLNVNSLGAKNVLRQGGLALLPGHLQTSTVHTVVYDGTQFILQNPAINPARVTVASHATTANIWVASDEIDFTGTETITDFPDAPKAGEWRVLHCSTTPTFTNNANIAVQGGATYTASAGDIVTVHATATNTFRLEITSQSEPPNVPSATESLAGKVELATTAEVQTGTDTGRVPSVSSLRSGLLVPKTPVTASGTNVDFTSLPSWVKRITVIFRDLSTNGTSDYWIRFSTGGAFETTGYSSFCSTAAATTEYGTSAVIVNNSVANASTRLTGTWTFENMTGNTWIGRGCLIDTFNSNNLFHGAAESTLGGTLDGVRITTASGDTFDNGTVNVIYE
jgi:hypothetical protein